MNIRFENDKTGEGLTLFLAPYDSKYLKSKVKELDGKDALLWYDEDNQTFIISYNDS